MKTQPNAIKALTVFTVGTLLVACGSGTSKSSSDHNGNSGSSDIIQQGPDVNLTPIDITAENYTHVASQSLKSLLLNDAGSNALNRSLTITGDRSSELGNIATGIVIQLHPYPCSHGGDVSFTADIDDSDENLQINFNNPVNIDFDSQFNNCNQAGNVLDGHVSLDMRGSLNQWLGGGSYNFESNLTTEGLWVEQIGMPGFTLEGEFDYIISSNDGVTVVAEVQSTNSMYAADTLYQMVDFNLTKSVNNNTQEYTYYLNSEFTDYYETGKSVQYQTLEPLTGVGFSLPTAGLIAINGADSSVMVFVEENEMLRLELDLGNDGVVDDSYYTNWNDLVMNAFTNVQF